MFVDACSQIAPSLYWIIGTTVGKPKGIAVLCGTGFVIAPGIIATAAHNLHWGGNRDADRMQKFEGIPGPEVRGANTRPLELIAEAGGDGPLEDVALLRDPNSSAASVHFHTEHVPVGTPCGSLGYPLSGVTHQNNQRTFDVVERLQAGHISARQGPMTDKGLSLQIYETDFFTYPGASGAPGFLTDGRVFGLLSGSNNEPPPPGKELDPQTARVAMSFWVPAAKIVELARRNGITLPS